MLTSPVWTFPEKELVAVLAASVASRANDVLDVEAIRPPFPGYVCHHGMNDFKIACLVLWRLGAAVGAINSERGGLTTTNSSPTYFKFLSASAIRSRIFTSLPSTAPAIDEVIEAYLRLACTYSGEDVYLSTGRAAFEPHSQFESQLLALKRVGYVEYAASATWTDRISPAMIAAHLWDEDGVPF
jgi:hypothetical protein